jgi:hypothetical protein
VKHFKKIGLLLLLLVMIPGWGETAGLDDVREAVALWDRVFVRVPALEQYIHSRRQPPRPPPRQETGWRSDGCSTGRTSVWENGRRQITSFDRSEKFETGWVSTASPISGGTWSVWPKDTLLTGIVKGRRML